MSAQNSEVSVRQSIVSDPLIIQLNATVADAITLISASNKNQKLTHESRIYGSSCLLVVTDTKKIVGILTKLELLKLCGQIENIGGSQSFLEKGFWGIVDQSLLETAIAEVMTYPVYTLLEWEFTDISVAVNRFQRYNICHLPLVNDSDEVVGLVTRDSLQPRQEVKIEASTILDSNDMFRQFVENSHGVVLIREINSGKLLYVSPAYEELWGKSCESLHQDPDSWMDSIHPEDRQIKDNLLNIGTGFFSEEYRIILTNGMIRWVWGRCFLIKNLNGEIYHAATVLEDITDRKSTEIALKESEQRLKESESLLKGMFERSVVGIAITGIDGRFVRTNPFFQEMVGYSESELEAMRFTDNMMLEEIEENLRLRNLVLSGEAESYQMEKRLFHRDGRTIWVRTTTSKILNDSGKEPVFVGVVEDISDRKQAEESLQSLVEGTAAHTGENFLPALAEYISKALEVRYVFITRRMGDFLELTLSWIDGQLQPASVIPMINMPCAMTIREGKFFCADNLQDSFVDNEIIKKLGANSCFGIAIINTKGETVGSLCVLDDKPITKVQRANAMLKVFAARVSAELERQEAITELYQLNQQLETRVIERTHELQSTNQQLIIEMAERQKLITLVESSNEELVRANTELARATKLKDEFLANMSHELRTPLNAILGMSEGLLTSVFGDLNERQRRSLSLIENSGRHLLELINDILDVAKIGAGKVTLEIQPVLIEQVCRASLSFVKQMASKKNIQLKLDIEPDLGAIAVDERRLKQALINLLSNAVKFTEESGKVSLDVKVIQLDRSEVLDSELPNNTTIFSVTDTGVGIAAEDIGKLFQTFVQIDSSMSRQYGGTGLGLTLVKQIAELHGGSVHVTSRFGEGSCFSILLPNRIKLNGSHRSYSTLSQSASFTNNLDDHKNSHPETNLSSSPINSLILLAEDNQTNVETFADYLSSRGYRLIFAVNGQEALDIAIAQKPDLILMDIQMPVLDGFRAIQQIRANPKLNHIPIVALTALAMDSDRDKCLQAGADEYLAKPVKLAELVTTIRQQLQKTRTSTL